MAAPISITRTIHIAAPRERVWNVLTDPARFGEWLTEFRFTAFEEGARFTMPVDENSAPPGILVTIAPPHTFAFRWTAAMDHEEMTLVTFKLEAVEDGTRITVTESEFELLGKDWRETPYNRNSKGWEFALEGLAKLATEGG